MKRVDLIVVACSAVSAFRRCRRRPTGCGTRPGGLVRPGELVTAGVPTLDDNAWITNAGTATMSGTATSDDLYLGAAGGTGSIMGLGRAPPGVDIYLDHCTGSNGTYTLGGTGTLRRTGVDGNFGVRGSVTQTGAGSYRGLLASGALTGSYGTSYNLSGSGQLSGGESEVVRRVGVDWYGGTGTSRTPAAPTGSRWTSPRPAARWRRHVQP